ncbi:MAG: UvrD-helicase domain-containing protein [Eubacteriales bacterium]|nr:UvrD-helicase domain-containing protein [Eubacteriales bacterium]
MSTKPVKWTAEQLEAINARNGRLLVAAAAGAGKTAVLVERIISRITDTNDPVDIDSLLVMTFTNAAASEMKERISAALTSALEQHPEKKELKRQMMLLNKATITTIHSFCLEVIKENNDLIEIDPGFRIADDIETELLKREVLDDFFESLYPDESTAKNEDENGAGSFGGHNAFLQLLEAYGGNRGDKALMELVLRIYNFAESSPDPEGWLKKAACMTGAGNSPAGGCDEESISCADFSETLYGEIILEDVLFELHEQVLRLRSALEEIRAAGGPAAYGPVFEEDLAQAEHLAGICTWEGFCSAFREIGFSRLPVVKKNEGADENIKQKVKDIRDNVKKKILHMRDEIFSKSTSETAVDMHSLRPLMESLSDLAAGFSFRYSEAKRTRAIADFNDLEHWCLKILSEKDADGMIKPSETAVAYRKRFREILIDEYQDSNMVQESIVSMISGDEERPGVFMVGDVKQSIYRFRQARPELFLGKYDAYGRGAECGERKILLYKNFRSRREIIEAVNQIFSGIMSKKAGEIDYTDEEALIPGAEYDIQGNMTAELCIVGAGPGTDGDAPAFDDNSENSRDNYNDINDDNNDYDHDGDGTGGVGAEAAAGLEGQDSGKVMPEAVAAASVITEMMDGGLLISDRSTGVKRPLRYRDIVILMRSVKNRADIFAEELAVRGIPVYSDTGAGFFRTPEVQVVISLLQIIDNPVQDIPLLSVLRSPIYGFSPDELALIRLTDKKTDFYSALVKTAESSRESSNEYAKVSEKASAFLGDLSKWREMSRHMTADMLIWQLYEDTAYFALAGAMPGGHRRQANLKVLFERARQFEQTSYKGLYNFICFIDRIRSGKSDMGSAKILGENDDVVRIMSIHKSKGLEFPVVILSGCGSPFNRQDVRASVLLHQDLGFGPDIVDSIRRVSHPSAAKIAMAVKSRHESLSEEMRILYVAMTRAREKLIITGVVKNPDRAVDKWNKTANRGDLSRNRLSVYDVCNAGSFLDWIAPIALHSRTGWRIRTFDMNAAEASRDREIFRESVLELPAAEASDGRMALDAEVRRRLEWVYPYIRQTVIPLKTTVTELKRRYDITAPEENIETQDSGSIKTGLRKPVFLGEREGLSAAEKGTVMHFVMQHLDITEAVEKSINPDESTNYLKVWLNELERRKLITNTQRKAINIRDISKFLLTDLAARMAKSKWMEREVPFNLEMPCAEIYEDFICGAEGDEIPSVLLQGVIDCCFEDEKGLVVLDYKTDTAFKGSDFSENDFIAEIRRRYTAQLEYYAAALERLTGISVVEKYIYSFSAGKAIAIHKDLPVAMKKEP